MVLGAGELQDPGRKWCDDDAEAEPAPREGDVRHRQRTQAERELVGLPAGHLRERRRGQDHPCHRRGARADAGREQATDHRADGHSNQETRKQNARAQLVELEHKAPEEWDVDEGDHQGHADQEVGRSGADEGAAAQEWAAE